MYQAVDTSVIQELSRRKDLSNLHPPVKMISHHPHSLFSLQPSMKDHLTSFSDLNTRPSSISPPQSVISSPFSHLTSKPSQVPSFNHALLLHHWLRQTHSLPSPPAYDPRLYLGQGRTSKSFVTESLQSLTM